MDIKMKTDRYGILCLWSLIALGAPSLADPVSVAHYLANEGVMVVRGETKVLFDPFMESGYGRYEVLPPDMKAALFAGTPPYDGIDAIFVSHYHGDHFSPSETLEFLRLRKGVRLYAPAQVVAGLRSNASAIDESIFERVTAITLEYGDEPVAFEADGIIVEAVRIPHSGWPTSLLDVENISFRITLDEVTTVLHIGDADTKDKHYQQDAEYWDKRRIDMAFPPYWYFSSKNGRYVLEHRLKPGHAVGIHVPVDMPGNDDDRAEEYRGFDLFTEPGETREIPEVEG